MALKVIEKQESIRSQTLLKSTITMSVPRCSFQLNKILMELTNIDITKDALQFVFDDEEPNIIGFQVVKQDVPNSHIIGKANNRFDNKKLASDIVGYLDLSYNGLYRFKVEKDLTYYMLTLIE